MSPWNAFPESVWFAMVSTCVFCFLHDMFLVLCSPMSFFCIRRFCLWKYFFDIGKVFFNHIFLHLLFFFCCLLQYQSKFVFAVSSHFIEDFLENLVLLFLLFSKIIALCFLFSLSFSPFLSFPFSPSVSFLSLSLFLLLSSSVSLHNSPCYVVSLFVPLCLSTSLCVSLCLLMSLCVCVCLSISLCVFLCLSVFLSALCVSFSSVVLSPSLALPFPSSFSLFLFQPLPFSVSLTFGHHDSHTYTYQMFLYFV